MSQPSYVGTAQRTFRTALLGMLERDYRLLGSRRVLELLTGDIETLVEEFYPPPERIGSGWMVFTGTRAQGPKAHPGQRAGDYALVTLAWPVLTTADIEALSQMPTSQKGTEARSAWWRGRLERIIEYGWRHPQGPVLLTMADLSAMLGLSVPRLCELLAEARQRTGKPLVTKGYYFDQGMKPTHKEEIIGWYEAGLDEVAVARRTGHAQKSVGHYLRDYERIKLLLAHGTPPEQISQLIGMRPTVTQVYVRLVERYHPELLRENSIPAS
jgi:hypothetical protein